MAEFRNQLWCRILLAICITMAITTGAIHDQDLLQSDILGCEPIHNESVVFFNQSASSSHCFRIWAPKGSGIQMDLQQTNSTWSVDDDFLYVDFYNLCQDHNIFALTSMTRPCSTQFDATSLDIHFKGSAVNMTFSSFQIDDNLPRSICSSDGFQNQGHHSKHCFDRTDFDEVYVFPQQIMTYDDMVRQHPSLNITAIIPDSRFQISELPPMNLDTSGKLNLKLLFKLFFTNVLFIIKQCVYMY